MHDNDFVHRDLTPRNIIIDENGNMRLIDFGLSIPIRQTFTDGRYSLIGSLNYLAPERFSGMFEDDGDINPGDRKSDIYAFALIIARTLSGTPDILSILNYPEKQDKNISYIDHWATSLIKGLEETPQESILNETELKKVGLPQGVIDLLKQATCYSPDYRYNGTLTQFLQELIQVMQVQEA